MKAWTSIAALGAALLVSAPAAQAASALAKTCAADVKQFCADVKPAKGAVADCLKSHTADVSDGCKDAMAKAEAGKK